MIQIETKQRAKTTNTTYIQTYIRAESERKSIHVIDKGYIFIRFGTIWSLLESKFAKHILLSYPWEMCGRDTQSAISSFCLYTYTNAPALGSVLPICSFSVSIHRAIFFPVFSPSSKPFRQQRKKYITEWTLEMKMNQMNWMRVCRRIIKMKTQLQ